jgi:protein-tyrosine phosphatase
MKILMVCLGNICRSPLAEGVLQHKATEAGLNWQIESAGTNGLHNGEPPHHLSQKVAKQNGIDISKQQSRKFTAADFDKYDKIYAMAGDVIDDIKRIAGKKYDALKVILFLNELHNDKNRDVPDPWAGPESGYHEVFALIDKTSDAIIEKYSRAGSNTFTKNKIEETI